MNRGLPKGVYPTRTDKFSAITWEFGGKLKYVGTFETPEEAAYNRLVAMQGHHWEGMPENPLNYFGFVYRITSLETGKIYIGSKQFHLWTGPKGGYKCTDPKDPRWNKTVWKESDWKDYTGSSEELNEEIAKKGKHMYRYEFMHLCRNKLDLHLTEVQYQVNNNVLEAVDANGNYKYYNKNIASKLFRAPYRVCDVEEARAMSIDFMEEYYLNPQKCSGCSSIIPFGISYCPRCGNGR
jgi:hypothetical protein